MLHLERQLVLNLKGPRSKNRGILATSQEIKAFLLVHVFRIEELNMIY